MGRTVPAHSQQIARFEEKLKSYRRGLRKEDQMVFDRLVEFAILHTQAGVMAAYSNPGDAIFLGIAIELQKQLNRQEARLAKLEAMLQQHG